MQAWLTQVAVWLTIVIIVGSEVQGQSLYRNLYIAAFFRTLGGRLFVHVCVQACVKVCVCERVFKLSHTNLCALAVLS